MFFPAIAGNLFRGTTIQWNTSNVTNMSKMFCEASSFDQPLRGWDISAVTNMDGIFEGATKFQSSRPSLRETV